MFSAISSFLRPLYARDVAEPHRAATPLELFFDLVAVIALSTVASSFHHTLAENHVAGEGSHLEGLLFFIMAYLIVWWPWNLFTWFGSAFDNDDPLYRLMVIVMMVGLMVIAADLSDFSASHHFGNVFVGYLIMRLALLVLWFRVGLHNPNLRKTMVRNLVGHCLVQTYWAFLVFGGLENNPLRLLLFFLGFTFELCVPWFAEKAGQTSWHPHHILERFGLLNIIVLGEILLGSKNLLQQALKHGLDLHLIFLAGCGIVIAFCLWWLYFTKGAHLVHSKISDTLLWNYGHNIIFLGALATGASLAASTEMHFRILESGVPQVSDAVRWAVCLSIATYVFGIWLVRDRFVCSPWQRWVLITVAVLIAFSPAFSRTPITPPLLLVLGVALRQLLSKTHSKP